MVDSLESILNPSILDRNKPILITGGNGFIGWHVASRLHRSGFLIRIADIAPNSAFTSPICSQLFVGNLCDQIFCRRVMHGVHIVFHFAATMGGMGTIHSANDFPIYTANHAMTQNVIQTSVEAGVKRFFYASSACVYSQSLQNDNTVDTADFRLGEADVWSNPPPSPQGLYGLEKLVSELILKNINQSHPIEVRIARFHNVYGPRGAWRNGHEKAPAALLRKAIAIKGMNATSGRMSMEIWGDGTQRRSFLFIDDCVEAIIRLVVSDCSDPVNIGSEDVVNIKTLAETALKSAGVDASCVKFEYDTLKPIGVAARNSNNDLVQRTLGWVPSVSLQEGMRITAEWMAGQVDSLVEGMGNPERTAILQQLQTSFLVDLKSDDIIFAILIPITSRGAAPPESCLLNLASFAQSVSRTTWRDIHALGDVGYHIRVYLAIDADDDFLTGQGGENKAETVLRDAGIVQVTTLICDRPKGHVCALWRDCARRAWEDGCTYFTLMGDDVTLQDEGWMRDIHAEFSRFSKAEGFPAGIGCVAFTDISFPGMPTFPVVHRTHMDIFNGDVIPHTFINQDGDPYLFQLYRRWGCSSMISSRIRNGIGGSDDARYQKQPAIGWTFGPLDEGIESVESWLREHHCAVEKKLALDIVIPCYRVQVSYLDRILQLKSSATCIVMFIIIIDDPQSPYIQELQHKYDIRPDVRIRVNKKNMGASASRNRGIQESAADWIQFLDDDIVPRHDLLFEAEKVIRSHPKAAGFVGNAQFPPADTVFTTAVHLAGVTFFWDIATKWDSKDGVPWGVTANLIARHSNDEVEYDLQFPKTGGGEDIDFCLKKHKSSIDRGGEGFHPAPHVIVTHPWWNGGLRSYWRFYMWSKGDGALVRLYPEHTYRDAAPNSAEMLLITAVISVPIVLLSIPTCELRLIVPPIIAVVSIILANVVYDVYRHLWRDHDRTTAIRSTVSGIRWIFAILESSFIRMASESGRVVGMLERREIAQFGWRFDWFVGRAGSGPREEERKNSLEKLLLALGILATLCSLTFIS